jgi:hypothetical protein
MSPRLDPRWGGSSPCRCGNFTRWKRQASPGAPTKAFRTADQALSGPSGVADQSVPCIRCAISPPGRDSMTSSESALLPVTTKPRPYIDGCCFGFRGAPNCREHSIFRKGTFPLSSLDLLREGRGVHRFAGFALTAQLFTLVSEPGLEPGRPCSRGILSSLCTS